MASCVRGRASRASILGAVAALLLAFPHPCAGEEGAHGAREAEESLSSLLRGARLRAPGLARDDNLAEAARRYALELGERGALDHTGRDGGRVVDRAREAGCTDARLGEVLGAGSDLVAVVSAWLASPLHRSVLLDASWTHVGVGVSEAGGIHVCVVIFARRAVEGLALSRGPEGSTVLSGRFVSPEAASPFLLVDLDRRPALGWNPRTGEFSFGFDAAWLAESYVRLGFVTASGSATVTNVLDARADFASAGD